MDIPRAAPKRRHPMVYGGLGLAGVVVATVLVGGMGPALPTVERATVFTDSVRRGTMRVEVRGPGTLVPEQIRWVSAVTAGRVERKLVQPGTVVDSGTLLIEMSNPDVQLQALDAERQLAAAEAQLVELRSSLETARLNQEATVATIETQYAEARRAVAVAETLAVNGLVSQMELENARGRARELERRVDIERERFAIMSSSATERVASQDGQVRRMRSIVAFQRGRLASMSVRAGTRGVLQDLPLEEGQWVNPGQILARVVQPERLKAVLRIPEAQVRDVVVGQAAWIDTRTDTIPGHVVRMDPAAQNGTVAVDIALDVTELPRGARPDLSVDGLIEVARLEDVLFIARPAFGQSGSTLGLFRLVDGDEAVRVSVRLGRSSVTSMQILGGADVGDVFILSDMSAWSDAERVRLR